MTKINLIRKKNVILILLSIVSITSYSQARLGIKGGLNLSSTLNEQGATNWKPSYHIGVTAQYGLGKKTSVAADLLYSDKGFGSLSNSIHFLYINLPVVLRYNLVSKFAVEVGGGVGYLLGSYRNGKDLDYLWGNKIDWELCTGVRYALSEHVSIGVRYEHGLSNVINKTTTTDVLDYRAIQPYDPLLNPPSSQTLRGLGLKEFNRNLQLSVSYIFGG